MTNYYIKKGNRYKAVGIGRGPELYEGIWLVQIEPGVKSYKNLICRMDDLPMPVDVKKLAKCHMLTDAICKVLMAHKDDCALYNHSYQEIADMVANETYKELTNGTSRNSKDR